MAKRMFHSIHTHLVAGDNVTGHLITRDKRVKPPNFCHRLIFRERLNATYRWR